ncbi:MAG: hypothetical protein J1E83_02645 [Lachnospiraceae bacterium]|nr:hypothetical protein [Lachnospiraceae bacterium]
MSIGNVTSSLFAAYQYADKAQKTAAGQTNFTEQLKNTAGGARVDAYLDYLKSKYGNVSIQSVGKDQTSLDRVGKSMSGNDVIIAPNILEEMANDPEKAAYYEQKIDHYFDDIVPKGISLFAAQGLVFEPAGVVVHEDGTVTYIAGCSDSPERVAQVQAERKAKSEKRAEQRREQLERSQEVAEQQKQIMESYLLRQTMTEAIYKSMFDAEANYHFIGQSQEIPFAITAYESAISTFSNSVMGNL